VISHLLPINVKAISRIECSVDIRRKDADGKHMRALLVYYQRPGLPGTTVINGSWYCLVQEKAVLFGWIDRRLTMLASVLGEAQGQFWEIVHRDP